MCTTHLHKRHGGVCGGQARVQRTCVRRHPARSSQHGPQPRRQPASSLVLLLLLLAVKVLPHAVARAQRVHRTRQRLGVARRPHLASFESTTPPV